MDYLIQEVARLEYEERVRWLRSLYGHSARHNQPSRMARLARRALYFVGKNLVSLGQRMQPRQDLPATAPVTK